MYEYWLNNFDFNEHKMQYEKIENFINSNNYVLVNKINYT